MHNMSETVCYMSANLYGIHRHQRGDFFSSLGTGQLGITARPSCVKSNVGICVSLPLSVLQDTLLYLVSVLMAWIDKGEKEMACRTGCSIELSVTEYQITAQRDSGRMMGGKHFLISEGLRLLSADYRSLALQYGN